MKTRLYFFTFILVAAVVIGFSYIGMTYALKYMQNKYVQLQLEINKRQAQNMAYFLENQIIKGVPQNEVKDYLQSAIKGSDTEKGFICMFDKYDAELLCHPDKNMLGMKLSSEFNFENSKTGEVNKTRNVILEGVAAGGLFHTEKNTDIAYMIPVKGTGWMLAAHENIENIKTEIMSQKEMFLIGFGILSIITAIIATIMARIVGRRYEKKIEEQNILLENTNEELKTTNNELNQKNQEIIVQKTIIEEQHEFVKQQKNQISEQNEQITSSIQYASRIQTAMLPPESLISEVFNDLFVYYQPKNIVSGDFYWFKKINNTIIFAVADSTGHGVPGAFMSMLGIAFLNEIINEETHDFNTCTASQILDELRDKIKNSLRQTGDNDQTKDGMDMAVILLNAETKAIQFAGAYNPLYIVRNKKLTEVEGDKMPVGVYLKDNESFSNKRAQLKEGDAIYMFSDGFYDQFGGELGRKFMKKSFRELLEDISDKTMLEQKEILHNILSEWKGSNEQSDDIVVAGIRI
jgi:serine phosphatase RsbU (regulator of sigma subunit)